MEQKIGFNDGQKMAIRGYLKKGYTQKEIAEKYGVSTFSICRIINGDITKERSELNKIIKYKRYRGLFLRTKKIKNNFYLYAVCNYWESDFRTKQRPIKFFGNIVNYTNKEIDNMRELLKQGIIPERKKSVHNKNNKKHYFGDKCQICGFDIATNLHHLEPNRPSTPMNMINLCPNHHAMVHKGIISKDALLEILKKEEEKRTKIGLISNS